MGITRFGGVCASEGVYIGAKGSEVEVISAAKTANLGKTSQTITSAATIAITPSAGYLATLTPGHDATITFATTGALEGQEFILKILTSGTTSYTLTFSTGTKVTGTLASGTTTARTFVMRFVFDGTDWLESSRTAAMA